jgi:DNA primase
MEITQIKQQLTLKTVLDYYGLKPDKSLRLLCPFHADKTPSLQVYYKTQTAYCFSSNCTTHGKSIDVIDFIMYKENISKSEAIQKAISMTGNTTTTPTANPESSTKPLLGKEQFLQNIFTYFKNGVCNSKPAQEYIKSRGLSPLGGVGGGLEIGYNAGQFHHGLRKEESLIKNCLEVGLLHDVGNKSRTGDKAYNVFGKYCIVFALKNQGNEITGLYFRSTVNDKDPRNAAGQAKHFYLKQRSGLYPGYPKKETTKLILTESIIDAATLLQVPEITSLYSVLALYGTNGLTGEHLTAIKALPQLTEIIFAFDSDEAGNKATLKYAEQLKMMNEQLKITKIELPCKDVNETLTAHNEEIFIHLLSERKNMFDQSSKGESFVSNKMQEDKNNNALLDTTHPHKIKYTSDTAVYYIQGGLPKTTDHLKIMLVIESKATGIKARNKIDLYEDKQVEKLCKEVAEKLQLRKEVLETDVYRLTDLLESHIENSLPNPSEGGATTPVILTMKERQELETFLKQPKLIKRLNELLGKTGIVGEERNRVFLLLIAISYKMKDTLHSLVQGSSGSGKTKIVRQVSDCIPPESVTRFTRISDKALYNYPQKYFTNRLLIIEDMDGLSEDAEMAFRELQSSGELRSSVSIKLENGQITGGEKIVTGPIASMSCTTKGELYEDNMSRVFLIAVDESSEQTQRIIAYQNQKASGKINSKQEEQTKICIQNLIRLIESKEVINPFAEKIQLPPEAHKIRRLNDLFQNFIKMVTLINQHQRKKNTQGKLIVEIEDITIAIEIMFESIVLKVDELDGSLRQFYEKLKAYLQKQYKENYSKIEFTQREIRQAMHLSKAQCSRYFTQLATLEYIVIKNENNLRKVHYKIDYWDSYTALRDRIKTNLKTQLDQLKGNNTEQ